MLRGKVAFISGVYLFADTKGKNNQNWQIVFISSYLSGVGARIKGSSQI